MKEDITSRNVLQALFQTNAPKSVLFVEDALQKLNCNKKRQNIYFRIPLVKPRIQIIHFIFSKVSPNKAMLLT